MQIALLLGLPYGVHDSQNDLSIANFDPSLSNEEKYQRQAVIISGLVIDRNSQPLNYAHTEDIDRQLDEAAAIMPQSWWQLPSEPMPEVVSLGFGRNQNSSSLFDRLMAQIW